MFSTLKEPNPLSPLPALRDLLRASKKMLANLPPLLLEQKDAGNLWGMDIFLFFFVKAVWHLSR